MNGDFSAAFTGENDPNCRNSLRVLVCGRQTLTNGDVRFWCTQIVTHPSNREQLHRRSKMCPVHGSAADKVGCSTMLGVTAVQVQNTSDGEGNPDLGCPISRDIAILLSLRCPISRDTFCSEVSTLSRDTISTAAGPLR